MADNSTQQGNDTIRTEEKGSSKTPVSLIDVGGTGGTESILGDSGVTMPVSGTITADLGATDNAVLDSIDTNTTNIPNVIGTDGTAGPTRAVSIGGTQSDGTFEEARVDADGHFQVDVVAALPAGSNSIGDIGTVTTVTTVSAVTTVSTVTTVSDAQVQGKAAENAAVSGNPVLSGGRYDATPRTLGDGDVGAIALDADGAVQIADGGNSITVDGTVTANLSATDNAVLDNIDTDTSNIDTNTTDLPNVIGTDGSAGPSKAVSIAGTDSSGNLQEIAVDTDGNVQVDVLNLAMQVVNAIDSAAYDIEAASFSETSAITTDYILDSIEFNFSSSESRTITVTSPDGTVIWTDTNTSADVVLEEINMAFNASENFTIEITQTAGACLVDVIAKVRHGGLTADAVATATVQGTDAEGAAVTAKPVLIAGQYDKTPRTVDDGDSVALASAPSGQLLVQANMIEQHNLLTGILSELKVLNLHMMFLSGQTITKKDLGE